MSISMDKQFLEFKLQNGIRYEEKGDISNPKNEYIRIGFKNYNKLFDLSQLNLQKTPDSLFKSGIKMQNIRQLDKLIDSLQKYPDSFARRTNAELKPYLNYLVYHDTDWKASKPTRLAVKNFDAVIPDSLKYVVEEKAASVILNLHNILEINTTDYANKNRDMRLTLSEWHKKFAVAAACLVLFFIGAPLGSIIRKGGLGLPLVFAIIFFLLFHLLDIFGEKFVKGGNLTPLEGSWLPIFVLLPLGVFLIYKATRDSQLFNKEYYYRIFRKLRLFVQPVLSKFIKIKQPV